MSDVVLYEVSDRIATVTLNRPEARNALSTAVMRLLPQRLREAEADPDVDVVVLTGTDPAFCAGVDLKELGTNERVLSAGGADGGPNGDGVRGPFPSMSKPLIGAINGVAITGGFELALNCDFLVASDRAKFGDTHTRVGVMPGWGLTVLLPQAVGVRRAREMSLTGNFMLADEALAFGLVNHVVAHEELHAVHPASRPRHHRQRSGRCAADEGHVCRDPRRRRGLADRGNHLGALAAGDVQPGEGRRPPRRHPATRPHDVRVSSAPGRARNPHHGALTW